MNIEEQKAEKQKTEQVSAASAKQVTARTTEQMPAVTMEHASVLTQESTFWSQLARGEKAVAVELDAPAGVDLTRFMAGAEELQAAGVDAITIADCPFAKARMDATLLACALRREMNVDVLPHMTCRDHNWNAARGLLYGAYAAGIRNVLLVTGDPIPPEERENIKGVYQFSSRDFAGHVAEFAQKELPEPFHIFGALNVNAPNFDVQLQMAEEKLAKGMAGFLTQPVLTEQGYENLLEARKKLQGAYLLGGIIPVVSERNARFMDSEIGGISVDPQLFDLYAGKDRAACEALAIEISTEILRRLAPYVDGFYLMTPFGRTGLIRAILEKAREEGLL